MHSTIVDRYPFLADFLDFGRVGTPDLGDVALAAGAYAAYDEDATSPDADRYPRTSSATGYAFHYYGLDHEPYRDEIDAEDEDEFCSGDEDDIEERVQSLLDDGKRFSPDEIIDLSFDIYSPDLLVELIRTSRPRFEQRHAYLLAPHWGDVQLEYHEDPHDRECRFGDEYRVNLPE